MVGRAVDVTVPSRAASKEVTHSAAKTNQNRMSGLKIDFGSSEMSAAGVAALPADSRGLFVLSMV